MRFLTICLLAGLLLLCSVAALGQTVEIQPNPMYVFLTHSIDPLTGQITIGDFSASGHTLQDLNLASFLVNDSIVPTGAVIVDSGGVLTLRINLFIKGFIEGYGLLWDSNDLPFTVSGLFLDGQPFAAGGIVTIIGRRSGDANNDNTVDIADATYLITYIFNHGRSPQPLHAGDANCDGTINIADVAYLINYVFSGGLEPCAKK